MKIVYSIICAVACFFTSYAQSNITSPTVLNTHTQSNQNKEVKQEVATAEQPLNNMPAKSDVLALKENEFDFGKIPQGKPVTHVFYFTNAGATALSLQNVQASCGCTTPEWSKDSVAAGETSKITVGYNAANMGPFTKSITITYNDNQSKQLLIKGEVWKTPATSAPENAALGSLKN